MPKLLMPIARLIIWAVIAVALVYLAFFKQAASEADTTAHQPSVDLSSPTIAVTVGSVANTVQLNGQITPEAPTTVKSTAAGQVGTVKVQVGSTVAKDDVLFTVKVPLPAAAPSGDPDSAPAAATTSYQLKNVVATAPGTIATLDVLPDQELQIGSTVATIDGGVLKVQAQLTSDIQYRMPTIPSAAMITATGGPAPFQCTDLHVVSATSQQPADPQPNPGIAPGGSGGLTLECSVPAGTAVYAGSAASMAIDAGSAADVLVLPVTAVDGKVSPGQVWVVGADGTPVATPVELGLTDGIVIEIKSGVTEGTEVLEFTPAEQEKPPQDGGMPVGPGG